MSVDAESRAGILMPHAAGNSYRVDAVGKQRAGVRVPQVVKAYTFKAVRIRKVAKPSAGRVMMQLRAIPCMDNPAFADLEMRGGALAILLIGAGLIEHRHHADRQRDDSLPSFAFRRAFKVAGLRSVLQGVADVDGAALPVHVAEPQGTDFTKRHFNPHSPHGER